MAKTARYLRRHIGPIVIGSFSEDALTLLVGRIRPARSRPDAAAWWVWLALAFCLLGAPAMAQQVAFSQHTAADEVVCSYRYRDFQRTEQSLDFRLPAREVEAAMRAFRDYSLVGLNQHIETAIAEAARKAGVTVNISVAADGSRSVKFRGPSDRVERLERGMPDVLEHARTDYLGRYWRRHEGDYVYIDYAAAVRQAMPAMRPLAMAFARRSPGQDERAMLQRALSFLQTIPYDELTEVRRFGGVDFAPAAALLKINAGDCDSTSVAIAALVKLMLPERAAIIVRSRPAGLRVEHALAMADLPPREGDATLRFDGRLFVALEASGPDQAAVGVVDDRIGEQLRRGEVIAVAVGR